MKTKRESFLLNGIKVGFGDHETQGTGFVTGAFINRVEIRGGRLDLNLLSPKLRLTAELHNGVMPSDDVAFLRLCSRVPLAVPDAQYNRSIKISKNNFASNFDVTGFPDAVFKGEILVKRGWIHLKGELISTWERKASVPVEVIKNFVPKRLIPKRKVFTLKQAKKSDPKEVYELDISSGSFDAFPKEILACTNLESLRLAPKQALYTEIPPQLGRLKKLHTLVLDGGKFTTLPEEINKLRALEELTVTAGALQRLPERIGNSNPS